VPQLTKVTADVISTNTISGLISAGFTSMNVASFVTQNINSGSANTLTLSANNTTAITIDTSGNVGISNTTPLAILTVNSAANTTSLSGTTLHLARDTNTILTMDSFGGSPQLIARTANGSSTTPSALLADRALLTIGARGFANTAFTSQVKSFIGIYSGENWTDSAQGTYINFHNTPVGSTTRAEVMRITANGNLGIATTAPAQRLHIGLTGANNYIQFGTTNEGFVIGRENATGEFTFDATQASPYNVFKWRQSGTERMRIAADGNVGIGAVPITKLHIQGHNSDVNTELRIEHPFAGGSATAAIRFKRNSSDFAYMGGAALSISGGAVDDLGISVVSGKNIVFGVNAAERMRISSGGDVLINTATSLGKLTLQVSGTTTPTNHSNLAPGIISLYNAGSGSSTDGTTGIFGWNSSGGIGSGIGFVRENLTDWGTQIRFYTHPTTTSNISDVTERMRIDSAGRVNINSSSNLDVSRLFVQMSSGDNAMSLRSYDSSTSVMMLQFYTAGNSRIGYIQTTGGTATVFSTSSDYRLKENIAPMTGALAKVSQLKPVTYKWKSNGSDGQGFIAHELAEVVPDCVTGEKDAIDEKGNPVHQGVDTSFLVATLTAAIQELKAEFDEYKRTHP
jgi:hypothetical protein